MQSTSYNTAKIVQEASIIEKEPIKILAYAANTDTENVICDPIDFSMGNNEIIDISERLIETCREYKVYCCTSNQVGLTLRLFIAGAEDNFVAFCNPEIIDTGGDISLHKEIDTISHFGLVLNVPRYNSITLKYYDYMGVLHTQRFDGMTARIIQQCIDRINGISFVSYVSEFQLDRAKKALSKKIKRIVKSRMSKVRLNSTK